MLKEKGLLCMYRFSVNLVVVVSGPSKPQAPGLTHYHYEMDKYIQIKGIS